MLGPRVVSAEVPETKVCSKLPSLLQTLRRPFAFANCKQRRNFPEKRTILEPKPTLRCQKRRKIGFGGASKPKNPQNEALSKENPALRLSALCCASCIGVSIDAYCVPVWWRSPSGTPRAVSARLCIISGGQSPQQKLCFHSQKTSHFKKQWWPPVLTTPNGFCALCVTSDVCSTAAYFSVRALISVLLCS